MTAFFVVALSVATIGSHWWRRSNNSRFPQDSSSVRWLADQQQQEGGDDDGGVVVDYTKYSCVKLMDMYPEPSEEQCLFAKHCNSGEGMFMSWVFCTKSYWTWCIVFSPILLLWMILLFRMLGSTAEEYFSPALEMFSFKLRLPPRFAGVSLLALGNGAADVSSTVNAITSDPQQGYLLSLGALTGSAMFIGTIVAGVVVLVADGVPCRGALVRDVLALWLTAIIVMSYVASGSIGPTAVSMFGSLYLLFVVIVLIADVYHRAVVLPRIQQQQEATEVARQLNEEQRANEVLANNLNELAHENNNQTPPQQQQAAPPPRSGGGVFSTMITALSNYDNKTTTTTNNNNNGNAGTDGWGVESSDLLEGEQPIVLHGANGLLSHNHHHHHHPMTRSGSDAADSNNPGTPYAMLEDGLDQMCNETGTGSYGAHNWRGAWHDGRQEIQTDLVQTWKDIWAQDDPEQEENQPTMWWDRAFQALEFPFTVLRKLSVPIPCEGYYNRGMVAASVALSPVWIAYYLVSTSDMKLVDLWWIAATCVGVTIVLGAFILRYAPGGEGVMSLTFAVRTLLYSTLFLSMHSLLTLDSFFLFLVDTHCSVWVYCGRNLD